MLTYSSQNYILPSDWLFVPSIVLSLLTMVISVSISKHFLNLNNMSRLLQLLIDNLNDKIRKIEFFIDRGCLPNKVDSNHLYEYLTELIRSLRRLSNLMHNLSELIGNYEFKIRNEFYSFQLDEIIMQLTSLHSQLADHLCITPIIFN